MPGVDILRSSGNTAARPASPGAGAIHYNTETRVIEQYTEGAWETLWVMGPKDNRTAVTDPTVDDDSGDGYSAGSVWINTDTGVLFMLTDATEGAAVWVQAGGGMEALSHIVLEYDVAVITPVNQTWTIIPFGSGNVVKNEGLHFDTGTHIWTPPAGKIITKLQGRLNVTNTNGNTIALHRNGLPGATAADSFAASYLRTGNSNGEVFGNSWIGESDGDDTYRAACYRWDAGSFQNFRWEGICLGTS